jgi:dihydropteroate synthase
VLGRSIRDLLGTVDRAGITPLAARARAPRPFPLEWGKRTYVMGILNLTTDSFSGDGLLTEADVLPTALAQARRFISAGADILDIGGESTRPGSAPVSAEDELRRVLPVLRALIAEGVDAILSVDTYKALVAEAALAAGADWINDVWALRADPGMAALAARTRAPLILMHNRLKPNSAELQERLGGRYVGVEYENLLADVKRELMESVEIARTAGVSDDRIILDPGLGFGKTVEHSLELVDRLDEIRALGFPLLVGPSRKSFIGYTLNLPPDQRVEGTAAAVAVSIARGADIIRVHDVEAMARVAHMTDAITRRGAPGGK